MSWAKVSDVMPSHPKLVAAGFGALGLYTAGLCYARRHRTDGTIPRVAAVTLDPACPASTARRLVEALVRVGLWETTATDYRIHDWLDWNDPAEVVKAREAINREKQRRWRERNPVSNELQDEASIPVSNESDVTGYQPSPRARVRVIETETETQYYPPISPPTGGTDRVLTTKAKPVPIRKLRPAPKPAPTEKARGGSFGRRPAKPEPPPASAAAVALTATYRRLFAARFGSAAPIVPRDEKTFDNLLRTHTADELEPLLEGFLRNGTKWSREQHAWTPQVFEAQLGTLISLKSRGDL